MCHYFNYCNMNIFTNNNDKQYIFIPIPNECYNLSLLHITNDKSKWALSYNLNNKMSDSIDFIDRLNSIATKLIDITSTNPLKFINTLDKITEEEVLSIIDSTKVDVNEVYYTDYINDEPITDGDYISSLKSLIHKQLDIFDNVAILEVLI